MSDGDARVDAALRWRLILGRHGDTALPLDPADPPEAAAEGDSSGDWVERLEADAIDRTLQFIYDREFAERAHRTASGGEGHDGLTVPAWLAGVRTLFPRDAVEVLEKDALTRYGLHELVTDPDVLREAEPSRDLLRAILQFKHRMTGAVLPIARQLVQQIVTQLAERLRTECAPALHGPVDPERRPAARTFRNVDW